MNGWWFIQTAPRDATWIEVMLRDGTILTAHWAEDESCEVQPPFRGWFTWSSCRTFFRQIETPDLWRSIPQQKAVA